jgi:DNA segregation ATPase FtsK/SpoIIIE-like protein
MGAVGSYVLVVVLLLGACTVAFGINWEGLAGRGMSALDGNVPRFWAWLKGAAGSAWTAARGGLGSLGVWMSERREVRRERRAERKERRLEAREAAEAEAEWEDDDDSVWEHEPSVWGDEPAVPSAPRVEIPIARPEPALGTGSGVTGVRFDVDARMDGEVPTQVAQRELVEVEYIPTSRPDATPPTPHRPVSIVELEEELAGASTPPPRASVYDIPPADQRRPSVLTPAPYVDEPAMGDGSIYEEPADRARPGTDVRGAGVSPLDAIEPQHLTPPPQMARPTLTPAPSAPAPAAAPAAAPAPAAQRPAPVVAPAPKPVVQPAVAAVVEEPEPDLSVAPVIIPDQVAPERGQVEAPRPKVRAAPPPNVRRKVTSNPEIQVGNLIAGGETGESDLIVRPGAQDIPFEAPSVSLLDQHDRSVGQVDDEALKKMAIALTQKLADFGIRGEVTAIRPGPVITIFEYLPAPGVKVSRIASLTDDIAMAMRAIRVRIVAPIPGKGVVGIEIPNKNRQFVWYRDMMVSREYRDSDWQLPMALGKTTDGRPMFSDLAKMPHLLVGGTTGSGKSVGVNAMLMTLLFHHAPEDMRLILIDPKMLEFELYNDIPHLLHPVVTEPKLANAALKWACKEMDDRYRILARWGTRNILSYNKKLAKEMEDWTPTKARRYAPRGWPKDQEPPVPRKLPYIVVVIDELADLMMVASKEVEESIVRLAQKARACGIHLIVATQRPSVDVITGLIKANMPSRIAFQVRSKTDGRTILDQNGAETLLGKGDMLFLPPGVSALARLHAPFVADEEVARVCDHLREQGAPIYEADIRVEDDLGGGGVEEEDYDENYDLAVQIVTEAGKASTSMIQRRLKIGYNRAARIIEMMEREGIVGPADGARPRKVLVPSIEA